MNFFLYRSNRALAGIAALAIAAVALLSGCGGTDNTAACKGQIQGAVDAMIFSLARTGDTPSEDALRALAPSCTKLTDAEYAPIAAKAWADNQDRIVQAAMLAAFGH